MSSIKNSFIAAKSLRHAISHFYLLNKIKLSNRYGSPSVIQLFKHFNRY